jgi:hypothetical protein
MIEITVGKKYVGEVGIPVTIVSTGKNDFSDYQRAYLGKFFVDLSSKRVYCCTHINASRNYVAGVTELHSIVLRDILDYSYRNVESSSLSSFRVYANELIKTERVIYRINEVEYIWLDGELYKIVLEDSYKFIKVDLLEEGFYQVDSCKFLHN